MRGVWRRLYPPERWKKRCSRAAVPSVDKACSLVRFPFASRPRAIVWIGGMRRENNKSGPEPDRLCAIAHRNTHEIACGRSPGSGVDKPVACRKRHLPISMDTVVFAASCSSTVAGAAPALNPMLLYRIRTGFPIKFQTRIELQAWHTVSRVPILRRWRCTVKRTWLKSV